LSFRFGSIQNYRNGMERKNETAQGMRELARLLEALQTKSKGNLTSFLKPERFDDLIKAVKTVSGFDGATPKLRLAVKLGYTLKKCLLIAKG